MIIFHQYEEKILKLIVSCVNAFYFFQIVQTCYLCCRIPATVNISIKQHTTELSISLRGFFHDFIGRTENPDH